MATNIVIAGGTHYNAQTINHVTANSGALKALTDAASPSAFHNSGSRHDPPKCHENTRVAVLKKLKDWVSGSDPETRDKWIMWLYGGAGAGKSAIGQTFAEKCDAECRLLASFFFGRSDETRNQAKFLAPTIACQVYKRVPEARDKMLSAVINDPMIFNSTLLTQMESLVVEPLIQLEDIVTRNVIVIDGLDECLERASQTAILYALFELVQRYNGCIRFLVASRPEHDIVTAFSLRDNTMLAKLVLDDEYQTFRDIELFLTDEIRRIKETHPFRHLISPEWPEDGVVIAIVRMSSGHFIYASTVIKFIESNRHRPDQRLDIVRHLRQAQGAMPFAELDALYTHILTSSQEVTTIVELLSFVLYSNQWYNGDVPALEEIHNLELGSLKLIFCDLGALVVIDERDRIKVLHASLLDFLLDPSRSKDLPISGNALMTKHITMCFRFLSKNKISDGTDHITYSTCIAVQFLDHYLGCIPVFTADMAEAFSGFSLLKLCQQDKLSIYDEHRFLKSVNPVILRLLRESNQHQFLSQYLSMMDKSFLALMDEYPPQTLALQISVMMHGDTFPRSALDLGFQLAAFLPEGDKLGILSFSDDSKDIGPTQANRYILHDFLVNPTRSQHHNFQSAEPRLYVMALLGCFGYLSKVVIREDCSIDEIWLNTHVSSVVLSKEMTLENQRVNATPENDCTAIIPCSSENYATIDTERDIKAWQRGWRDDFEADEFFSVRTRLCDMVNLNHRYGHDSRYSKLLQGRYYLMLGYMIYFFPLAGFSQDLIELCKTTVLRKDQRLFPEQTASAQRAMEAYLRRMAEITDGNQNNAHENNTIFSYPSTSFETSLENVPHSSRGSPDQPEESAKVTIPTVSGIAPDAAYPPSTATAVALVPVASSSMSRTPPAHLDVNSEISIQVSPAASQVNTPPAEIANDSGTKMKKSKKDIFSRWWRAPKRT